MATETPKKHPGEIANHRGWTIVQNGDGIICLDEKGSHCLPGGVTHHSVESARKSIDNFLLADRDAHLFWLLCGQGGTEHLSSQGGRTEANGDGFHNIMKRDNPEYRPSFEYIHTVKVTAETERIQVTSEEDLQNLSVESALALSIVLRRAAVSALEIKRRKPATITKTELT